MDKRLLLYSGELDLGKYRTRSDARKVKKFHENISGYRCIISEVFGIWKVRQTIVPLKGK